MSQEPRTVVLVSGGVNSCVAAALRESSPLALLHVRYPHRAADRELECFHALAKHLAVGETLEAELPHLARIPGNARVDRQIPIENAATLGDGEANTYGPGLMPAMLSTAFQWACAIDADRIVVGVSENLGPPGPPTATLYPDCRREVYQLFDELFRLSRPGKPAIRIVTPLIDLPRADIIRLGQRVGAPLHLTWSCYESNDKPCEQCYRCVTRARGFIEAGLPDPLLAAAEPES